MIGEAPAMQDVFRIIGRLSRSSISACLLINGESGTGKELVAHALHRHNPRAKRRLSRAQYGGHPERFD
ncbi:sigma 54-interacting transcriptional regulator [Salmonella enterica subsp. enterica]|nr:sigma 54-interacting transcriptional regulator [Salmonella enterica subsp. enterica]